MLAYTFNKTAWHIAYWRAQLATGMRAIFCVPTEARKIELVKQFALTDHEASFVHVLGGDLRGQPSFLVE